MEKYSINERKKSDWFLMSNNILYCEFAWTGSSHNKIYQDPLWPNIWSSLI